MRNTKTKITNQATPGTKQDQRTDNAGARWGNRQRQEVESHNKTHEDILQNNICLMLWFV